MNILQFAAELKMPVAALVKQLAMAGVIKTATDFVSEEDKAHLLDYLRKSHGDYRKAHDGVVDSSSMLDKRAKIKRQTRDVLAMSHEERNKILEEEAKFIEESARARRLLEEESSKAKIKENDHCLCKSHLGNLKVIFDSEESARLVAKFSRSYQRAYKCPKGYGWHLTSNEEVLPRAEQEPEQKPRQTWRKVSPDEDYS